MTTQCSVTAICKLIKGFVEALDHSEGSIQYARSSTGPSHVFTLNLNTPVIYNKINNQTDATIRVY